MNFVELMERHGIEYRAEGHHHCRPGWIQIDCPFCGKGSGKFHLGYSLEDHYTNCWSCGHHSVHAVLTQLLGIGYADAKRMLSDTRPEKVVTERISGNYKPPSGVGFLLRQHKKYLINRGFDPHDIQILWSIKGIAIHPNLPWRIFIPIYYHGQPVSWTTRSISNEKGIVRYMSADKQSESIPHKTLLYGEDYARHAIIVCEGPTDVWAIGPGAVATFGLSFTNEQIDKMSRYPVRAVCLDSDRESQKVARKLVDTLSAFPGETMNVVLESEDAGEASHREIRKLRKEVLR